MVTGSPKTAGRQFWLWVGKPGSFYVDGRPSEILVDGWHTCHRDTKRGDLALRWVTNPTKQIAYLLQAKSDAYDLSASSRARKLRWRFGCDFHVVCRFKVPLTLPDIRADVYLENWNALRASFQGTAFAMQADIWRKVNSRLCMLNHGYAKVLRRVQKRLARGIILEEQLEKRLVNNLAILKPHGFDLTLYKEGNNGVTGRQMICPGQRGRIDLLCQNKTKRGYVVIELKNVMATRETFGQVSSYVGSLKKGIGKKSNVTGLVISRGCDQGFRHCLSLTNKVKHLDLTKIGFR